MYNNPIAIVVRNAFIKHVTEQPLTTNEQYSRNTIANILRHKRITLFERAINNYMKKSGLDKVPAIPQQIDEKNLLTFSLQLSGYIRDAQKTLHKLRNEHASDKDLIDLYKAAAKYSCDCNNQIEGSKYIFKEHCDYNFWKMHINGDLANARFTNHGFIVSPKRKNLIMSMPFHINGTQEELRLWSAKYMAETLNDSNVFGKQVDVYMAHFPIEQPRGEKFALSLETINNPETYYTDEDIAFAATNLKHFLGKDIKTDTSGKILSGQAHTPEEFKEYCSNLTIFGYCAGTGHAHRWLNAFSHLANQLYDKQTTNDAIKNIFVISYAFLPIQDHSKYSGVHFMSNYTEDTNRKEPFVKMFRPQLYEHCKYRSNSGPCNITLMPDNRNYVIALPLPERFTIGEKNPQNLQNIENGHNIAVLTYKNQSSIYSHPQTVFKNVLTNASLGKRKSEVFNSIPLISKNHPNLNSVVQRRYARAK